MKNIIYYFSGTGNNLAVARDIAEKLGEARTEAVGMAPAAVDDDCESVGIVFPIYYYSIPSIVKRFAETINLMNVQYVYAVATYGGGAGTAFKHLEESIGKSGGRLSAAYGVLMPGNYIVKYSAFPDAYQNYVLKRSYKKAADIARCIGERKPTSIPQGGAFARRTEAGNLATVADFGRAGARFVVSDACTGCGTCVKVCPVANIKLSPDNKKPVWGNACEQCVACIQWCPVCAIEYGTITVKRKRYHHPKVKAADLYRV